MYHNDIIMDVPELNQAHQVDKIIHLKHKKQLILVTSE